MNLTLNLLLCAVVLACGCAAEEDTKPAITLEVAAEPSAAPEAAPLHAAAWVKGKPVDLAKLRGKKVAVVEFWATWCPPCRESIPYLSALQKKYADQAVFIGVTDEPLETVKPFVEKMGDGIAYTIMVDDQDQTSDAYMAAFKEEYIPHAFIVDKSGKIVFHANPMDDTFEPALEKAIAAT